MAEAFNAYHRWLGIPLREQPPNHYRLLGLELFESDPEVIDSAADRQMAHVRTFQSGPHSAESQIVLNALSAARLCLLHPQKRSAYDEVLRTQLDSANVSLPMTAPARVPPPSEIPPPTIEVIPPALATPFTPPPLPDHFGVQIPRPQISQPPSTYKAPPPPPSYTNLPINPGPRRTSLPSVAVIVGIGCALLVGSLIVGGLLWSRLNGRGDQSLAGLPRKVFRFPDSSGSPLVVTPGPNLFVPRETRLPGRAGEPKFSSDSAWLFYHDSNQIHIWNLAEQRFVAAVAAASPHYAISPDGTKLAAEVPASTYSYATVIAILDRATQRRLCELRCPSDQATFSASFRVCGFDSTSERLFTRTDTELQVWDVNSGLKLRSIKKTMLRDNSASSVSTNGQCISVKAPLSSVIDTATETVIPINVNSDELTGFLGRRPLGWGLNGPWCFSADGQRLYGVVDSNSLLLQWSLPEMKAISGVVIKDLFTALVSPDETRILVRLKSPRDTLYLLDAGSLQTIAALKMNSGIVSQYAISPDHRWILVRGTTESKLYDFGR